MQLLAHVTVMELPVAAAIFAGGCVAGATLVVALLRASRVTGRS